MKKEDVGLLVAEKITKTRDGLICWSKMSPKKKFESLNVSRQMPQCVSRIPIIEESRDGHTVTPQKQRCRIYFKEANKMLYSMSQ